MIMNKRGISPLIATVLIIGFTIVLAVLVITWISGTVEDATDDTDCMVEAENKCLASVGDISLSGIAGSALTITNDGSTVFSQIHAVDLDADGATIGTVYEVSGGLGAYDTDNAHPIDGFAESVRVIPTVVGDDGACSTECGPVEISVVV